MVCPPIVPVTTVAPVARDVAKVEEVEEAFGHGSPKDGPKLAAPKLWGTTDTAVPPPEEPTLRRSACLSIDRNVQGILTRNSACIGQSRSACAQDLTINIRSAAQEYRSNRSPKLHGERKVTARAS